MIMLPRSPNLPLVTEARSAAAVSRFIARVNAHDLTGIGLLIPRNGMMVDSLGFAFLGWEQVTAAWRSLLRAIPSYRIEADSIIPDGSVIAVHGRSSGELIDGTSRKGVIRFTLPATWYVAVRGSWITQWYLCFDSDVARHTMPEPFAL